MASDAPQPAARKILLNSGRKRHDESLPLDGTTEMPQHAFDEADLTDDDEDDMAEKERTEKVFAAIESAKAWMSKEELAKATNIKPGPLGYQPRKLIAAKRIHAHGNSNRRVYGMPGLTPPGDAAVPRKGKGRKHKANGAAVRRGGLDVQTSARVKRVVTPPPVGGLPRFGYFSDGSLLLDCTSCKGTLTQADLVALRDFTRTFEENAA